MISSKIYKVVIVGGGAAGIATASRLLEGGLKDFIVLEARHEIGGRLKAETFGGGKVELGAKWIHGETNNVVHELAKTWGMISEDKLFKEEDPRFLTNYGEELSEERLKELFKVSATIQTKLTQLNDQKNKYPNQGEFYNEMMEKEFVARNLDKEMSELGRDFMCWFSKLQANIDGSGSLYCSSLEEQSAYQECEGDQTISFKKGIVYQDFLKRLAHGVESNIMLGEKVTTIVRNKDNVEIITTSGMKFNCKYAIITVSLGVLKNDYEELFEPPLPSSKIAAIKNLGFGTVSKIFVEYPTDWCNIDPKASDAGYSFIRRKEGQWRNVPNAPWQDSAFGFYPDDHNPRVLIIWLSGPAAISVESIPQTILLDQVHSLISSFLSPHIASLPRPVAVLSTSWYTDPLYRGSYSFLASGSQTCIAKILDDSTDLNKQLDSRPVDKLTELTKPEANIAKRAKSVDNIIEVAKPADQKERAKPVDNIAKVAMPVD